MISIADALTLVGAGAFLSILSVFCGVVIHNRWLDRKLAPKKPIVVVQPAQKQTP